MTSDGLDDLAEEDHRVRSLVGRYYSRISQLHGIASTTVAAIRLIRYVASAKLPNTSPMRNYWRNVARRNPLSPAAQWRQAGPRAPRN